jgi:hypothetical protein
MAEFAGNVNGINIKNACTPLIKAIRQNNRRMVEFLLFLKADPNFIYKNLSPLILAVKQNKIGIIDILAQGPFLDFNIVVNWVIYTSYESIQAILSFFS